MFRLSKPLILIILDGWGHSENRLYNAINAAKKPVWDMLWACYPRTLLSASGRDVGSPDGQMGNSEVGHMSIGSGRIVDQILTRISKDIQCGDFHRNTVLTQNLDRVRSGNHALHLLVPLVQWGRTWT